MSMRDRLEEYVDGLLSEEDARAFEEELERDASLRAELERVRRFDAFLGGLRRDRAEVHRVVATVQRTRRRRRWAFAAVGVAAALACAVLFWPRSGDTADPVHAIIEQQARAFGKRLGVMAAARRDGRVPRVGVGDLEVPPSATWGLVFDAALGELGVAVRGEDSATVKDLVRRHFMRVQRLGRDLESQCLRAEAALELFRRLRDVAGADVANAYYDVFRPALADPETARRVEAGSLPVVVRRIAPDAADRYVEAYDHAMALLESRYGEPQLALVLERLAPVDPRALRRDAADDGVGRDAILTIRAHMYRAALAAGLDVVLIDVS